MQECGRCQEQLSDAEDYVTCGPCCRSFHYDNGSGLSEKTWRTKSAEMKKKWRCPLYCRGTPLTPTEIIPQSPLEQPKEISLKDIMETLTKVQGQLSHLNMSMALLTSKQVDLISQLEMEREKNKKKDARVTKLEEDNG